jgi:uncharacterized protein involved in exopolysaccharide biosynthesis
MSFDPERVARLSAGECLESGKYVAANDYDALLALYHSLTGLIAEADESIVELSRTLPELRALERQRVEADARITDILQRIQTKGKPQ